MCCVCVYVYGCDIVDRWRGGCGTDEWGDRVTGRWIDNDAGVCARGASTHARVPSCAGTFARVHACADALCGRQAPARTPAVLVLPVRLFAGQHEDLPALGRFPPGASVPLRAPAAVVPAGSRRVRAPLPARAASPTHTAGRGAWVVGRRRRRVRPSAACAARGSARRRRHGAGDPGHGQFLGSCSASPMARGALRALLRRAGARAEAEACRRAWPPRPVPSSWRGFASSAQPEAYSEYEGNLRLGTAALRQNDLAKAVDFLTKACATERGRMCPAALSGLCTALIWSNEREKAQAVALGAVHRGVYTGELRPSAPGAPAHHALARACSHSFVREPRPCRCGAAAHQRHTRPAFGALPRPHCPGVPGGAGRHAAPRGERGEPHAGH